MRKSALLAMTLVAMLSMSACSSGNNGGNNGEAAEGGGNGANAGTNANAGANSGKTDGDAAATNEGAANSEVKGEVTFLTNRTDMIDKEYNDYEKKFEAKYPGVDLKFETIANDYNSQLKVRIASGKYPDVVLIADAIPNSDFPKYFEPLDDIQFSDELNFKDMKSFEGKSYGISSGGNTFGIVYNKQAFAKAGITDVPKTLDELYADSQKLKDAGIVPFASNFKDKWPLGAWSNDVVSIISGKPDVGNLRAETDTPYAQDSAYFQSWSIIREMYSKGFLEKDVNSTNWEQSKKDVATGKFAMYGLGNWVINQVIGAGAKSEDVGFFPFPADNSGTPKAPLGSDFFYAVNKGGNTAAAKAFIQWMIEESGYEDFAGFIPTLKNKQSGLAQLAEFKGYNPTFVEAVAGSDKATQIQNEAKIDQEALVQEFVLSKDPIKVIDKANEQWAKARKKVQ
ncbi:ABC transporter substrate-binding protein [Paenibacillus aurantiacus]|uniref:ABC transporter substrate-binding protein n=1 Tax=Paenibacillus aurantiacus TaxID=1936118 RepID=A0ABV5KVB1_9BACL